MGQPVESNVELLAATEFTIDWDSERMSIPDAEDSCYIIPEFAGRSCYESFSRPNKATENPADYIKNIIKIGHESVLEHQNVTLYLTGVSRSLTHEIIRHRHLSPSQRSQRYVDEGDSNWIIPPAIKGHIGKEVNFNQSVQKSIQTYNDLVEDLLEQGLPRKQAREAARGVLPNAVETKIVLTGNVRAWRHFMRLRMHESADQEIRQVAAKVFDLFKHRLGYAYVEDLQELRDTVSL